MPSRLAKLLLLSGAVFLLYFYGLQRVGLLSEDEPRYVAIAQSMAATGDWITPRLWGEPWFEKPALLYWMAGLGFLLKLPPELAARIPVALASLAFLVFFRRALKRQFGCRESAFATAILATSAGWLAFSHVAVTDLPMAAAFATAMLLALEWSMSGTQSNRTLYLAAAFLGLAVLAKGLVPLVLAAPIAMLGYRRWRAAIPAAAITVAVAAPWYIACYLRNGWPFIEEFFIRHHFSRFASPELQHVQPWWFYLPVLLAAFFPWTPAVALLFDRAAYRDPRIRFLAAWLVWGLLFFSASSNKLPGYLLPLLPAAAALLGFRLAKSERAGPILAITALLVSVIPVIAQILPTALADGLSRASLPRVSFLWPAAGLLAATLAWYADRTRHRPWAVIGLCAAIVAGVAGIKLYTFPRLDNQVSARAAYRRLGPEAARACHQNLERRLVYGLSFYAGTAISECTETSASPRVVIEEDGVVYLTKPTIQ